MSQLSRRNRLIVISVVVIAALLMITVLPFLVHDSLGKVQNAQLARIAKFTAENNPQAPLIAPTPALTGWTFPLYMSLSMFAGMIILFIAKPLYNGAKWAKALALVCFAMPSIGGAYMLVPYLNFVKTGFPPALYIMAMGLIPYFTVILANKNSWKHKAIDFWVFLMLGVTAAEAWSNGHASHRILLGHPKMPLYAEGIFILAPSRNISWIAVIFLVAAIYLLALRKKSGWYAAMFGAANIGLIGFATGYVRTATLDYVWQGLMGAAIVISLLIPIIKKQMTAEASDDTDEKSTAEIPAQGSGLSL